ncbi:MAG: DUF502 domain-containing protein [Calditrichaceae bacterium]|nr:DUF502 domain-containing protein [Calditrichia bacterium]NUQ40812.1 DUF502 domain-containing protein [Calditrichaceae bacterium]
MKGFFSHIKKYIIRGILAIIPLVLSYFVVRLLYLSIDRRVTGLIDNLIGFSIPGLGIVILLIIFYLIGIVGSNFVGKKFFNLIERISDRIPLVKTTYQVGKQLSSTFLLPERQAFKKVVLVDFLMPGMWTVGFVTGAVIDRKNNNEKLLKVYVPTPPNPTSGTLVIVRESQTRDPGWSIEEGMKAVISGGIIGPEELR